MSDEKTVAAATPSHNYVTFTDAPDVKDIEDDVTHPDNLQCSNLFVQSIDNSEFYVAGNDAMKFLHISETAPFEYATRSETLPAEVFDSEDVPLPDNFSQISNNIDIPKDQIFDDETLATDVFDDESRQYEFRDIEPHAIDVGIDANILDYEAMEFLSDEKYNLPTIHEHFVAPQTDAPSDEHFEHGNIEVCASNAVHPWTLPISLTHK